MAPLGSGNDGCLGGRGVRVRVGSSRAGVVSQALRQHGGGPRMLGVAMLGAVCCEDRPGARGQRVELMMRPRMSTGEEGTVLPAS